LFFNPGTKQGYTIKIKGMAKHKKKHRRHRRVGALNLGDKKTQGLIKLGSLLAGYFMGDTINGYVDKVLPTETTTTSTGTTTAPSQMAGIVGELGIGGLLLLKKMASGTTGTILMATGGLIAGAGIKRALKKAGVITGYQAVPVIGGHLGRKRVTGFQSVPVIGKIPPQLSGKMPAQLQGYKVGGYVPNGSGASMGYCDDGGSGLMAGASSYMH
jgi:hypothetical protein